MREGEDLETLAAAGRALREAGYTGRALFAALGLDEPTGTAMDGAWWMLTPRAGGRLARMIDLLVRGASLPRRSAVEVLPDELFALGLMAESRGDVRCKGMIVPIDDDFVWTDRPERAFELGGLFLPDSTSMALRRALPPWRVERHLDIGSGPGAVALAAARLADRVDALDLEPRAALACWRSFGLSDIPPPRLWSGDCAEAAALGTFDRVSFVFPLLLPWPGEGGGGPIHTNAPRESMLRELLVQLPRLLAPGGVALFFAQQHVGDGCVRDVLADAFGARAWSAALLWDYEGTVAGRPVRAGVIAVRADRTGGWVERAHPRAVGADHGAWGLFEEIFAGDRGRR